jgi:Ca2+-binding RTX toxin-like protein
VCRFGTPRITVLCGQACGSIGGVEYGAFAMTLPTYTVSPGDPGPMPQPDAITVGAEQTVIFDPLANDQDAGHTGVFLDQTGNFYFGIGSDYTQPVDADGVQHGELHLVQGPDGYAVFSYTADDADLDVGVHTLTFSYDIVDENQTSTRTTVTITVNGNSTPGETINGCAFTCNTINGGNGNDVLNGGLLNDKINGGGGADTIHGLTGFDVLNGGAGNDRLYGDLGMDTLNGGAGDDTMTGSFIGHDTFVIDFNSGQDVITNFQPGCLTTHYEMDRHHHMESVQVFTPRDTIDVSVADWANFNDLLAHAQQVGRNVVIATDSGASSLTLQNVYIGSLHSGDFVFG